MSALGSLNLHAGTVFGNGDYVGGTYGYTGATSGVTGGNGSVWQLQRQGAYCASAEDADYENIMYYLEKGEIDTALQMYEDIEQMYGESSANKGFKRVAGMSMNQAVQETCSGSFATGLMKGLPIIGAFANSTSEAEAVAELADREVSWKDKAKETIGGVVSSVATGGAVVGAGVAASTFLGCAAAGPIGWAVGIGLAAVGLAQTFLKK